MIILLRLVSVSQSFKSKVKLSFGNEAMLSSMINWNWLFCESISQEVAITITSCNNDIAIGI